MVTLVPAILVNVLQLGMGKKSAGTDSPVQLVPMPRTGAQLLALEVVSACT